MMGGKFSKRVQSSYGDLIHLLDVQPFVQGRQLCDFLIVFLHANPQVLLGVQEVKQEITKSTLKLVPVREDQFSEWRQNQCQSCLP